MTRISYPFCLYALDDFRMSGRHWTFGKRSKYLSQRITGKRHYNHFIHKSKFFCKFQELHLVSELWTSWTKISYKWSSWCFPLKSDNKGIINFLICECDYKHIVFLYTCLCTCVQLLWILWLKDSVFGWGGQRGLPAHEPWWQLILQKCK